MYKCIDTLVPYVPHCMYSYIYLSQYSVQEVFTYNYDAKNLIYFLPDKGFWFVVVSPFTFDPAIFAKLLHEKDQAVNMQR